MFSRNKTKLQGIYAVQEKMNTVITTETWSTRVVGLPKQNETNKQTKLLLCLKSKR